MGSYGKGCKEGTRETLEDRSVITRGQAGPWASEGGEIRPVGPCGSMGEVANTGVRLQLDQALRDGKPDEIGRGVEVELLHHSEFVELNRLHRDT